jgi:hypothetical protein
MIKKICLVIAIVLSFVSASAVQPAKFQVALDYHYNLGLSQHMAGWTDNTGTHGNSLHLSLLYHINAAYTVGIGVGMDRYEPGANTLPLFATFRYRPFSNTKFADFYAFTNLGYSVSSDDGLDLTPGFMGDLGIGWSKMFRKHFGINLQIGYNLKQFRLPVNYYYDYDYYDYNSGDDYVTYPEFTHMSLWRHSLSFGFGLVF